VCGFVENSGPEFYGVSGGLGKDVVGNGVLGQAQSAAGVEASFRVVLQRNRAGFADEAVFVEGETHTVAPIDVLRADPEVVVVGTADTSSDGTRPSRSREQRSAVGIGDRFAA